MPESLPLQDHCGRQALIAHAFREGSMVGTLVVDFVRKVLGGDTVLALLVGFVRLLTLIFNFLEEMLETFMLDILDTFLLLHAVGALLVGRMSTHKLLLFQALLRNSQTVNALAIGTMITMRFLHLLISIEFVLGLPWRRLRGLLLHGGVNLHDFIFLVLFLHFWLTLSLACYR
mmetsp:Transcript_35838/g.34874  ORF Transcript_35838/g.34874 Transcript_35838/m.34874 type:complete len:174 (-) Transcript_35838:245-766(-)